VTDTDHQPAALTPTGDLPRLTAWKSLKQRLWRRLYVRRGSLIHDPDFGEGFKDMVDAPLTPNLLSRLASGARTGVLKDEAVTVAQAEAYEAESGKVIVRLQMLTATGEERDLNMVF